MKFEDINAWARLLNESEEQNRAYDRACEEAAAEDAALELQEFDDLDVKQVDPKTLGITDESDEDNRFFDVVDDESDDTIDFSAYGIDEADERDPVSHLLDDVGVKASTASLAAQDAAQVSMVEAITRLTEAIKDLKGGKKEEKIEEDEFDDLSAQEKELQAQVDAIQSQLKRINTEILKDPSKNVVKLQSNLDKVNDKLDDLKAQILDEKDPKKLATLEGVLASTEKRYDKFRQQLEDAVTNGDGGTAEVVAALNAELQRIQPLLADVTTKLDKMAIDALAAEEPAGTTIGTVAGDALDRAKAGAKAADRSPITDEDWDKIDAMDDVVDKLSYMQQIASRPGLTDDDQRSITDDMVFVIQDATNDVENPAFQTAVRLQRRSASRQLNDKEIEEFKDAVSKCSEYEREVLFSNALVDGEVANVFRQITPNPPEESKGGLGRNIENSTAFDRMYDPTKDRINTSGEDRPGEWIEFPFGANATSTPVVNQKRDLKKEIKRIEDWYKAHADEIRTSKVNDRIVRAQRNDKPITADDWADLKAAFTPDELDAIEQQMLDDANGDPAERGVVKALFRDGLAVTQDDIQMAAGYRPGTGGFVQQGQAHVDLMLFAMADYYGICEDESKQLKETFRNQNRRHEAAEARDAIFQDLVAEVWKGEKTVQQVWQEHRETVERACELNARYSVEDMIRTKHQATAASVNARTRAIAAGQTPDIPSETEIERMVRDRMEKMLTMKLPATGTPDINGSKAEWKAAERIVLLMLEETIKYAKQEGDYQILRQPFLDYDANMKIVKLKTGLDGAENKRLQFLFDKALKNLDRMSDEEKIELVKLDLLRRKRETAMTDGQAEEIAVDIATTPEGYDGETFEDVIERLTKVYMRGRSNNYRADLAIHGNNGRNDDAE